MVRLPKIVHGFKPLTVFAKSSILNIWQCSYLSLPWASLTLKQTHCMKSVRIQIFFWSVFSCIRTKNMKMRTKRTPYLDTFHAVALFKIVPTFQIKQKQVRKSIKTKRRRKQNIPSYEQRPQNKVWSLFCRLWTWLKLVKALVLSMFIGNIILVTYLKK